MAKKKTKKKAKKKTSEKTVSARSSKQTAQESAPAPAKAPKLTPYPQAGRVVTEFEEKLDQQLAGADIPKRGRGRPRKEIEQPPPEIDITIVAEVLQIPFDLWAISQDVNGLKLSKQESIIMAKPAKTLIDYYLPQIPEIAWAWIGFTAVSYSIMKTRLVLIAEVRKAKKDGLSPEQKDAARGSSPPQGQGGPHPSAAFPSMEEIKNPADNEVIK